MTEKPQPEPASAAPASKRRRSRQPQQPPVPVVYEADLAYPGVRWDGVAGQWTASVDFAGAAIDLGGFGDWAEAILCRMRAETDASCSRDPAVRAAAMREAVKAAECERPLAEKVAKGIDGESSCRGTARPPLGPGVPRAPPPLSGEALLTLQRRAARLAAEGASVPGVYKEPSSGGDKWKVCIKISTQGKSQKVHLGYFAKLADAIERRLRAEADKAAGRHPKSGLALVAASLVPATATALAGGVLRTKATLELRERARALALQVRHG